MKTKWSYRHNRIPLEVDGVIVLFISHCSFSSLPVPYILYILDWLNFSVNLRTPSCLRLPRPPSLPLSPSQPVCLQNEVKLKLPPLSHHSQSLSASWRAVVSLINAAASHTAVGLWSLLQWLSPLAEGMIGSAGVMEWQMNSGLHEENE